MPSVTLWLAAEVKLRWRTVLNIWVYLNNSGWHKLAAEGQARCLALKHSCTQVSVLSGVQMFTFSATLFFYVVVWMSFQCTDGEAHA